MVLRILELTGCMSDKELDDIREANRTEQRVKPIHTQNLMLREITMNDSELLRQLGMSQTREEAHELVLHIIKNGDQNPRKHIELAVLLSDSPQKGSSRFIGRIGARVADIGVETTDTKLTLASETMLNPRQPVPNSMWLYIFLDPELDDQGYASEAMDAFIPVLAKEFGCRPLPGVAELKDSCPSDEKTGTSSDLAGQWGIRRIDKRVTKDSTVFHIEFDT
jgi:RimJ/RimL family protein N-acetyltransferase